MIGQDDLVVLNGEGCSGEAGGAEQAPLKRTVEVVGIMIQFDSDLTDLGEGCLTPLQSV